MKSISYISNRKNKNIQKATIESLPHELLTEILAKTAASSFTGLYAAKLSSKFFSKAASENKVFQNISTEKSPLIYWWRSSNEDAANSFWEKCKDSKNPDALFMQGVVYYFGWKRQEESGLEFLKQAAKLGDNRAHYTLGIIKLISEDEEEKQKGLQVISELKRSEISLKECREKLKFIVGRICRTEKFRNKRRRYCLINHDRKPAWENDNEDETQCDACQCEQEVASLCSLFASV